MENVGSKPTTFRKQSGRSANWVNPPSVFFIKNIIHSHTTINFTHLNSPVDWRPRTENFTLIVCQTFALNYLTYSLIVLFPFFFIVAIIAPLIYITLYRGMGSANGCSASVFNLLYRKDVFFMDPLWFPNSIDSYHSFLFLFIEKYFY